jgi:hypothetical protein
VSLFEPRYKRYAAWPAVLWCRLRGHRREEWFYSGPITRCITCGDEQDCPRCNGRGVRDLDGCPHCGGTGKPSGNRVPGMIEEARVAAAKRGEPWAAKS